MITTIFSIYLTVQYYLNPPPQRPPGLPKKRQQIAMVIYEENVGIRR